MELNKGFTYSQALRALRDVLGPQAAIKRCNNTIQVGMQQGNVFVAWGEGESYEKALWHAFEGSFMEIAERNKKMIEEAAANQKTAISIDSNQNPINSSDPNSILELEG